MNHGFDNLFLQQVAVLCATSQLKPLQSGPGFNAYIKFDNR